jgi:predicted nucleotidyltransferase
LRNFRKIAVEEANRTIKETPNLISFFVYGSVARGDPTPSSDIDSIAVIDAPSAYYSVVQKQGILVSKEFHPKQHYGQIEALTHRVYDAWIIYDPSGFFGNVQKNLRAYFYSTPAKRMRIAMRTQLAELSLDKARKASITDPISTPIHLRSFGEQIGIVLHELVELSPSMRRFMCSIRNIAEELDQKTLADELMDILGYSEYSLRWQERAIRGVDGLQRLMYGFTIDKEFVHDREILNPLLAQEYVKGTREISALGDKYACLFPCQLYASMVLFRRNPAMKTFFKALGLRSSSEEEHPDYIANLRRLGFSDAFFGYYEDIFLPDDNYLEWLQLRVQLAQHYFETVGRIAEKMIGE